MPPRQKKDTDLPQLSVDEGQFFYAMAKHAKGTPSVDWNAAASDLGFKNVTVAKTRFGQIMKKYRTSDAAPSASAGPSGAPKGVKKSTGRVGSKGRSAKTKAKAKGKGQGKKAQDVLNETEREDADDEEEIAEEKEKKSPTPKPGRKK